MNSYGSSRKEIQLPAFVLSLPLPPSQTENNMHGIKDLHCLLFMLNNNEATQSTMKKILSNKRQMTREKANILRDIGMEQILMSKKHPPKFVIKPPNQ